MDTIYGKLLFCHGILEESVDKKISTGEYNNRTVYDWFKNHFTADFGSPALYPPTITVDDRPHPYKRACYTLDLLPAAISVASENTVSTLTAPFYSPRLLLLPYDYPKPPSVQKINISLTVVGLK